VKRRKQAARSSAFDIERNQLAGGISK